MTFKSGVYQIRNTENGHVYIGSSKNCDDRWRHHCKALRGNRHHSIYLQRAWNKYGEHCFVFEVLEECAPEQRFLREQAYLDKGYQYNTSSVASGGNGPVTEEHKRKISEANLGRSLSEEHRLAISNGNKGNEFTQTHRQNLSKAQKRRFESETERQKMADLRRGKPSGPFSEEHRRKLSESKKAYWAKRRGEAV